MPQLTWLGDAEAKRAARRVPYRLLDPVEQVGDPAAQNMLIQGDNLDALKALMPFYAGRVKCIFIDPPYNTKSAFEHYDDNLEHSQWLSMMYPRLELLRDLLSEDGSIWITIDDNEGQYLKVLLDDVFGRNNFVAAVIWEKSDSPKMDSEYFSSRHDNVLCYARSSEVVSIARLPIDAGHYDKTAADGRKYYLKPLRAMGGQGDSRATRPNLYFAMSAPDGTIIFPVRADGSDGAWRWSRERVADEGQRIEWIRGRNDKWAPYFRIFADTSSGRPPETIWFHEEVGSNRTSKAEIKKLFPNLPPFGTPKPESLLARIITVATRRGEVVLDSFLGSGTTAAVAHKMGRSYIGIEMGQNADTYCVPRLKQVVAGEQGGISDQMHWQGGGGFRYFKLGERAFDENGRIHPSIRFATLAAYLWFLDAGAPHPTGAFDSPLLGVHGEAAHFLLYNGILGDRRPDGGNVLTRQVLDDLIALTPSHRGPRVVYGEASRLSPARAKQAGVEFRQIPYEIRMR